MRYRLQRRGGKGVRDIKTEGRNGPVIAVAAVRGGQDVILVTKNGMVNRTPADQIRQCGRNTKGVRLINLRSEDQVLRVAVVERDPEPPADETGVQEAPPPPPPAA